MTTIKRISVWFILLTLVGAAIGTAQDVAIVEARAIV